MASAREMRLRIRSIKNIAQVTRALQTVSASKVRKAMAAEMKTRPYAEKSWKVLMHLARQPGSASLHPLLNDRDQVRRVLVVLVTGDRGLAGAYNMNVIRAALIHFKDFTQPVDYIAVGRKGRDLLIRRGKKVVADFRDLPSPAGFGDVRPIGRIVIEDFLDETYDEVYLVYTDFLSMARQKVEVRKLLPLVVTYEEKEGEAHNKTHASKSVFTYEPDEDELLDQIIPRFTNVQIFQAVLTSQASEHAARMMTMRNASENARSLIGILQMDYNKFRQQSITNDLLDIVSGAEALAHSQEEPAVQASKTKHTAGSKTIRPPAKRSTRTVTPLITNGQN